MHLPILARSAFDRVRQPAYTGENRCGPCTVVNVLLALAFSLAIAWWVLPLGAVSLALFLAIISLRGYLVPGTPTLTHQYLPDWVLKRFYTRQSTPVYHIDDSREPLDAEAILLEGDALESHLDGTDLRLTPAFEASWHDRMRAIQSSNYAASVSDLLERDADSVTVDTSDGHCIVLQDGLPIAEWGSEAALVADLAASEPLASRVADWNDLTVGERGQLLTGLRVFLETCPRCDGSLEFVENDVELCCGRSLEALTLRCTDCDRDLIGFDSSSLADTQAL